MQANAHEMGWPEWADSDSDVALAGLTGPEFGLSADEAAEWAAAQQQADQWAAIHRAALVAAAEAIKGRNWAAKREALALADQAWGCADVMVRTVFGTAREVPARYADLVELGRGVTSAHVVEAKAVIRADADAARLAERRRLEASRAAIRASRPSAADRAAMAAARDAEQAAREAEKAAAAQAEAAQSEADRAAGEVALAEVIGAAIGCEWIEEGKTILAEDGREFMRIDVSKMLLTDLGRMLRVAPNRRVEVARLGECWRRYLVREVR